MLAGPSNHNGHVASIHDRVIFKQPGLDQRLQYDYYLRKSLLDHFFDNDASLAGIASGQACERGDFLVSPLRGARPPQSRSHPGSALKRKAMPGAIRSRSPRA